MKPDMTLLGKTLGKAGLLTASALFLSACGSLDRISEIGRTPDVTPIENPVMRQDYQPVSLPMPAPEHSARSPNSLWQANRQTFFKDQRAGQIGDILTVLIDIEDEAAMENESARSRNSSEGASMGSLLGYEQALDRALPEAVDNDNLAEFGADSSSSGAGSTEREEDIQLKMAALVTQTLPNGNLVIHGRQEVRVNYEKRILEINGVIRPEDISINNTISYEQIAEARITYGGQGHITDMQQPRYGQQLYDVIFPF